MPATNKPTTPATPTYSIAAVDASHPEGDSGPTAYTFTISRTVDHGVATVDYAVTGAQTHGADTNDFVGGAWPSGTVTFAKGQTSQTITIPVAGDHLVEANENFTVTLSHTSQGKIGTATATGTIQNDDVVAHTNLITNGGFETGDFSGWTRSGNPGLTSVGSAIPHSGTFETVILPNKSQQQLVRTIP